MHRLNQSLSALPDFFFCRCAPDTRHLEFCERIEQRRVQYEVLRCEEQQPIQTRDEVCSKLAQETYALFRLMLEANYPRPLSKSTTYAIDNLWAYPAIRDYWDNLDAKLVMPALHICQNEDTYAFYLIVDLLKFNSGIPNTQAGRYSRPPPFSERRHVRNAVSIFENINELISADEDETYIYWVPLVLIKLRLYFELQFLLYDQNKLAELRAKPDRRYLVAGRSRRSHRDMKTIIHDDNLEQRVTSLKDEICDLAQFGNSMGDDWKNFWKYMCFPSTCSWSQEHPLDAAPEQTRMLIYANHHAWVGTTGASVEMGSWGFLGDDWARHLLT
ncbi:hypothetical protein MANI_014535 [Metarhizium anisopliae]|nr:hypothetical protein MANI_014535 [Metarhizium anisopliae]